MSITSWIKTYLPVVILNSFQDLFRDTLYINPSQEQSLTPYRFSQRDAFGEDQHRNYNLHIKNFINHPS